MILPAFPFFQLSSFPIVTLDIAVHVTYGGADAFTLKRCCFWSEMQSRNAIDITILITPMIHVSVNTLM